MSDARVGERARAGHGWFGAPQEGQVPVRAANAADAGLGAAAGKAPESARPRWVRRGLRVVRDLAICVALIAIVPLGLSVSPFRWAAFPYTYSGNTVPKLRWVEHTRPFAAAKDASITPMQAGLALSALQPERPSGTFVYRAIDERFARPWADKPMPAGSFGAAGRNNGWNGPNNMEILKRVPKGVSAPELTYLKMIAVAPVWPAFDLVARAPSVDVIGGRFVLPFDRRAHLAELPLWRFSSTKELAYASVSRAAYYLAIGKKAEAEAVLKRTIGFGFVFIDNATSEIDALIGRVIVGIGRGGLQDLYAVTGDPRAADVRSAMEPNKLAAYQGRWAMNGEERRQMRILNAADHTLPRAVRLENLYELSRTVCTNPREMILGPSADIREAYARAGKELARFPSERALLDLVLTDPSRPVPPMPAPSSMPARLIVGTATIASRIFQNPRMAFCTRVIVESSRF